MKQGRSSGGAGRQVILARLAVGLVTAFEGRPEGRGRRRTELEILHEDVSDDQSPVDLQLDDSHAYVLTRSEVVRFSKASGARERVSGVVDLARRLALSPTHVYWADSGWPGGGIYRAPLGGGERVLLNPHHHGLSVALNDRHVYWTSGGAVWRANLDGGDAVELVTYQHGPHDIAVQGDHVYWLNDGRDAAVMRAGLDGHDVQTLALTGTPAVSLAVTSTHVYWGPLDGEARSRDLVRHVSREGGRATPAYAGGEPGGWVNALVSHQDSVYFADSRDRQGRVYRLDTLSGTPEVVAEDPLLVDTWQLAVDERHVYFITNDHRKRVGRFPRASGASLQ